MGADGEYGMYNGVGGRPILFGIAADYGQLAPRRFTLDPDGSLKIYSWDSVRRYWLPMWKAIDFLCNISGLCGPYGICYSAYNQYRCVCPPGFHEVDPQDTSQGCAADEPIGCPATKVTFVTLRNTDFPDNYVYKLNSSYSLIECTHMCSINCNCVGFIYLTDGAGGCYVKSHSLINGVTAPYLNMASYLKVPSSEVLPPSWLTKSSESIQGFTSGTLPNDITLESPGPTPSKKADTLVVALASSIGSASVVFASMCALFLVYTRKWHIKARASYTNQSPGAPRCFSYKELQIATENFKEILGIGGFGSVYKGYLPDLGPVAVKKLDKLHRSGEREFKAEVETIGSIHHINLVRLFGFCSERSQRLLVYEYLSYGSLDRFLFDDAINNPQKGKKQQLDWNTRLKIALETARGIAYLHDQCRDCIIHCDIKPQNILLDDQFTPKVSDFGLAKLLGRDQTHTFTTLRGTRGYVAPEWFSNHPITAKADVYSYGMVLLELLAGRRNVELKPTSIFDFKMWVFEQIENGRLDDVVDRVMMMNSEYYPEEEITNKQSRAEIHIVGAIERAVRASFWCTQQDASVRPSMARVVQMLEANYIEGMLFLSPDNPSWSLRSGDLQSGDAQAGNNPSSISGIFQGSQSSIEMSKNATSH